MICPVNTKINVVKSYDAELDAWRGGAKLCRDIIKKGQLKEFSISKTAYEECGHHYLKEHGCSNYLYSKTKLSNIEFNCQ